MEGRFSDGVSLINKAEEQAGGDPFFKYSTVSGGTPGQYSVGHSIITIDGSTMGKYDEVLRLKSLGTCTVRLQYITLEVPEQEDSAASFVMAVHTAVQYTILQSPQRTASLFPFNLQPTP